MDRIIPLENDKNSTYKLENILMVENAYRGISVAVEYNNELVIGSFMDKSIATC